MTTYFHGTDADLQIGDYLYPGSTLGASANHGRSEHVYLTTDAHSPLDPDVTEFAMREAYAWAQTACMVAEDERDEESPAAFVYIVEPSNDLEADGGEDVGEEAVRCSTAKIIGVVDGYDLLALHSGYGKSYIY